MNRFLNFFVKNLSKPLKSKEKGDIIKSQKADSCSVKKLRGEKTNEQDRFN